MMMALKAHLKCVSPLAQKFVGVVYFLFFFHHRLIFLFSNYFALCDLFGRDADRKISALNAKRCAMPFYNNVFETRSHYVYVHYITAAIICCRQAANNSILFLQRAMCML